MDNVLIFLIGAFAFSIPVLCLLDLIWIVIKRKRFLSPIKNLFLEIWVVIFIPFAFLNLQVKNDCCADSAAFSPDHILSVWVLVIVCASVFFFTRNRKTTAPPLTELLVNLILVIGVVFNFFLINQEDTYGLLGTLPILFLFFIRLVESHRLIQSEISKELNYENVWESNAYFVLRLNLWQKYPVLLILCLPVLVLFASVLLILGQQPDSLIKAFTDTYKHGFSQLDYQCDNVQCGGHYLCSIAAQGHANVVKPLRYGHRNGGLIICNRQLLISNAFEEMILERFPKSHKLIRRNYDRIGDVVKSHYHLFSIKWVSDVVYILMKPLEWMFLVTLYLFARNPESKIAKQYSITNRISV